jgi:2'-5' RNA ligase
VARLAPWGTVALSRSGQARSDVRALRVFFGLWPDAEARDRLAELARATSERARGRAPPPANLHMTLAFVGEVPLASVAKLSSIGRNASAMAFPFPLTLDCIGAFHRQGVAWAGASSPPAELVRLATALGAGLAAQGWRLERRAFQAHVTLARRCRISVGDPLRDGESLPVPIVWNVARMTLAASELASGPPRYRELDAWPLAAEDQGG